MELKAFIGKFADCFNDKKEVITASTRFKELEEWSSMLALIVIATIDTDYKITITAEDIAAAETVEDLFKIVTAK